MSITALPLEILQIIFEKLNGREVARCRAVCRLWRDLVDSLPDRVWRNLCHLEFGTPKSEATEHGAHRELYHSLSLWDKVEEADLEMPDLVDPSTIVTRFKILENHVLAIVTIDKSDFNSYSPWLGNTICYYDSISLRFIRRQRYAFNFVDYNENHNLIMMAELNSTPRDSDELHIIIKSNNTESIWPLSYTAAIDSECCCALFPNSVYFLKEPRILCVARLKLVDKEEKIEIDELTSIQESIITFALNSEDILTILSFRYNGDPDSEIPTRELNIYIWQDTVLKLCGQILFTVNFVNEFKKYGLSWSDPCIYNFFREHLPPPLFPLRDRGGKIMDLDFMGAHAHNHVVLMGSRERSVLIYKRPYNTNGELVYAEPDREIDVLKRIPHIVYTGSPEGVWMLNAVEIVNGHRIFVLCEFKMHVLDLVHRERPRRAGKRTAGTNDDAVDEEPSTSGRKRPRTE